MSDDGDISPDLAKFYRQSRPSCYATFVRLELSLKPLRHSHRPAIINIALRFLDQSLNNDKNIKTSKRNKLELL